MKPYYQDASVTIYHGDCREVLPSLGADLSIVSDPPYGMKWNADSTRFSGGSRMLLSGVKRKAVANDDKPFDPSPLMAYSSVVLFGANHFPQHLQPGTWLIWTKKPAARYGSFLSDAEIAWMKGGRGVYVREFQWEGINRAEERGEHFHPTQKPAAIMRWCIEMGGGTHTVCDPYMGSGSTLVAAKSLGRSVVGIELDEDYCEIAARRCSQETLDLGAA